MPANAIAKELADLGRSDARLLSRQTAVLIKLNDIHAGLAANRQARCDLLTTAAGMAKNAGTIDQPTADAVIAPKDE